MVFTPAVAEQRFVLDHVVGISDLTDTDMVDANYNYQNVQRQQDTSQYSQSYDAIKAGFDVTVADAVPGRAAQFQAEHGGTAAPDPAAAAAGADAVITMLPTGEQVSAVVHQIIGKLSPGSLVIEMSSGIPGVTRQLAEQLAAAGVAMIDSPVSGGVPRAKTGDLAILAGGADADLDRADPLLRAMGTSIHRCAHARHSARNCSTGTSSLSRPDLRYCSSICHSIGRPWQSQPGM